MKRRNFLINSMATLGGGALFAGCKKEELIQKEGQVVKRKFKDIEVPLLGFGCSRFPMKNEKEIDMYELDKMVEYALAHGVNYFDNAYFYVDFKSENAMSEILKKYPRDSYILSDKSPTAKLRTKEDVRKIFNEQLKKCNVDYFDFYMAHGISEDNYDIYKKVELHKQLLELKKEGKIKYIGFSFHGTIDMLKEIVAEKKWDCCQLQINYLDWNVIKAKEQYEIAQKAGIPVVIMEPLRGGWLINMIHQEAIQELKNNYPNITPAEFGLRWAASLDNVVTVLSGMSNLEQVKQNVSVFENFKPMTQEEKEVAKKINEVIQSQGDISCTACKYCLSECPKGINIPAIFAMYNQFKILKNKMMFKTNYEALSRSEKAENCTKCGLCSKICPQKLDIPDLLTQVVNKYSEIKSDFELSRAKSNTKKL